MSVCIGASATGARTYTATASQGLLYMAEAVYNASGLGLPIVMTVANRAIGAPINIWNDHSDSMSQRDSGWIQLFVESNQEAVDVHVQAFRLAEELSLPVMVCMDGFILTHAVERVELPDPGAGRRVPAAVRPAPDARPRRADHDRRDGRAGGVHGGPLPDARQAAAGAGADPARSRRVRGRVRPRLRRARARLPRSRTPTRSIVALGSVLGTIEDVVDARRERGERIGALAIRTFRPYPLEAVRAALAAREARDRGREGVRRRRRRDRRPERPARAQRPRHRGPRRDRRPRRARRSPRRRWTGCSTVRSPADLPALTFLDLDAGSSSASSRAPAARTPRTCCATSPGGSEMPYQVGSFAVGNRLLPPEERTGAGRRAARQRDHEGPSRVPGLRRGARRPLRASTPRCARAPAG